MSLFYLSYRYLRANSLSTLVNLLLIGLGVSILLILLIGGKQSEENFSRNLQGIDMVVGAKGSPQQIILSAVYHADYPTGNITLQSVQAIVNNSLVKKAIPLGLGDSYQGFRIVGTNWSYVQHYAATLAVGRVWAKPMEVCIGSQVAVALNLKIGSNFAGSHGLAADGEAHEQPYKVVGILNATQTVIDRLILTDLANVWHIHATHEEEQEKDHDHQETQQQEKATTKEADSLSQSITALLLQFKSPLGNVMLPRLVNQTDNLQAAVPAMEVARLFLLVGTGTDFVQKFAYLILFMGFFNLFVVFYNALQARRYDLALLRTLGASALQTATLLLLEASILVGLGIGLGAIVGHSSLLVINQLGERWLVFDPYQFYVEEFLIFALVWALALAAALVPAWQAYTLQVGEVLKKGG